MGDAYPNLASATQLRIMDVLRVEEERFLRDAWKTAWRSWNTALSGGAKVIAG
jgi:hypothetical protein